MWAKLSWALEALGALPLPMGTAHWSPHGDPPPMGHLRNDAGGGFPLIFPLPRNLLLVWFWMGKKKRKSVRQILLNLPGYEECALSVIWAAWTS